MKNNFLQILGAACLVLFMGSSITSCSVEDGIDGTNGIDGVDGQNGIDGADGQDGADGADGADAIGLEEFANYGSIAIQVQGTRPDSVAFDQETELEFISPRFYDNSFEDDDPDLEFDFLRLVNAPNVDEVNGVNIELYVEDHGLSSQNFNFDIEFSDFVVVSEDLRYISLSDSYSGPINTNDKIGRSNVADTLSINEYSFDDTTNNLKFSFTMDIAAANNETGNDLTISGTVDVIVFENVGLND